MPIVNPTRPAVGTAFVTCAAANDALAQITPGSVHLISTSPRYWDLIDYTQAAAGTPRASWRPGAGRPGAAGESLADYAREHAETCGWFAEVTAPDAVVCLEIDDYRDRVGRGLVPLPDLWRDMLSAAGFRILEHIRLVRTLALGRRSGNFKRYDGRPGYYLPDNVCSTLIVATKGDPLARLRRDAAPGDRLDVAWAERFLKNAWLVPPPRRTQAASAVGHPVPQDPEVAAACVSFYSLPGDVVLDPYGGTGTTAREAIRRGRVPYVIEREPRFAEAIRAMLRAEGADVAALEQAGRRPLVPGAQFALSLGASVEAVARAAFLRGAMGEVSDRVRRMAARVSQESGIAIPPELVALMLRAERGVYYDRRSGPSSQAA